MHKPDVIIRLGAGKRTIEFADQKADLNKLDKKEYGGVMRALRQGFGKEGK